MSEESKGPVTVNGWGQLGRLTPARIALGRSGVSIPTAPHLAFQLAHARARNAVHHDLDTRAVTAALASLGLTAIEVASAAGSRATYLQRPDQGRVLDAASRATLLHERTRAAADCDLAIVVGDGLSAFAIEKHAGGLLEALLPAVRARGWTLAPVAVVRHARVAVGDEIGAIFGAKLVVVLIGERPGLSSPDSLGIYMTYAPRPGLTDESRNCISNVRSEGLSYASAAHKLVYLMGEALQRGHSGVLLKDEAGTPALSGPAGGAPPPLS